MKLLDRTHKTFPPEKAEQIAKEMQKNDPEWKYVVRHDPSGRGNSFIEVFDEEGNFVERL